MSTAAKASGGAVSAAVTFSRQKVTQCRSLSAPTPRAGDSSLPDEVEPNPAASAAPTGALPARPRPSSSPLLADASRKRVIDKMLRVDHAGELGARQIYSGQLAVFGGTTIGGVIQHMAAQEQKHLDAFDRLIVERRVRPTAMMPIWNVAGYALGLGTALLGKEAAMACTVAVEEVIAEHYNDQVRTLLQDGWEDEEQLRATFREFRDDELEHKDTGIEHDAERAPMYKAFSAVIKAGCHTAIRVTERL
jgi:3-demethoxyubiquinol 3-hydroxylase